MQGLSCFWAIIPNREVKFICLPCLVWLALLFFSLFCLFSWGQQIFSGDYSYTCEVSFFSLLLGYYIVSYHIIPISHHISGKHLLLCLSVLMSKKNAISPKSPLVQRIYCTARTTPQTTSPSLYVLLFFCLKNNIKIMSQKMIVSPDKQSVYR